VDESRQRAATTGPLMLVALVPYWFEHYDEVYEFTVLTGAVI